MTMNTGLARALRRFASGSAVMLMILGGVHEMIFNADPELPPRDVDRIVVTSPEGRSHEITDPARVAGIVRLVRAHGDDGVRPRYLGPNLRGWEMAFHRGAERPRHALWRDHMLIIPSGENTALIVIGAGDVAEFRRLLRAEAHPPPSAEGDRE